MSMAYTPHTWNNEVITDAKLNAIEQGVRTGTLLSGTDIDADKDWAGKAITNIGALQNQTGNLGARSGFVDAPGNTLRVSFSPGTVLGTNETATVATFTIPATYSSTIDSNLRIAVTKSTDARTDHYLTVTVKRGGVTIGTGTIAFNVGSGYIDTTGGCKAGDVITIEAQNTWGGTYVITDITVHTVAVLSTRRLDIPALKVFPEGEAW